MAAFEPCFAPPPPAGVAASARYDAGGGVDDLSSNLSNDLSRTMDGTLGGSAMSAGFRTARAGLDTAEFGRALASPEKPGYSSALSPPMSPEHVKAEHDVLAALTLEAEIDADADAYAARVAEHAARHTPRGKVDPRGDAEGTEPGIGRTKMLPPPSTRSATVRHNSWTAETSNPRGHDTDDDDTDGDDNEDDSSPVRLGLHLHGCFLLRGFRVGERRSRRPRGPRRGRQVPGFHRRRGAHDAGDRREPRAGVE